MRVWQNATPLEDRDPQTSSGSSSLAWGTGANVVVAKYGGALPALTSRAVYVPALFDLKPWLRREASSAANDGVTSVDTSAACDSYDPALHFLVSSSVTSTILEEVAATASLRVWYFEEGHPFDASKAKVFKRKQEITDRFIAEVSEVWSYTVAPTGMRYWRAGLIFEALTASLPSLTVAYSIH